MPQVRSVFVSLALVHVELGKNDRLRDQSKYLFALEDDGLFRMSRDSKNRTTMFPYGRHNPHRGPHLALVM